MKPEYDAALRDFSEALKSWRTWSRLGWRDVRRRYVRSLIGPFWITVSLGILVLTLSVVWTNLWKVNLKDYVPFVSAGVICWAMISTILTDSCALFVTAEPLIRSMKFPYSILSLALVWKHLVFFFHNLLIYVLVILFFGVPVNAYSMLAIPGLLFVWLNGWWLSTLLGLLGARFRDVQQLVLPVLQIVFFVTPIFWPAEQMSARASPYLVDMNLVFHFIEVVRMPMLGRPPALVNWAVVICCTVAGWLVTLWFFGRFRRRLPYWL